MAIYECFESFAAFEQYLKESGPELSPQVRLLMTEYCKYALDRAWFYYPDALPADILSKDVRNGHIDRTLSFPLEDLYGDGQAPGQVGQEIYGSGAAFIFASKAFHAVQGAPFLLFCDHFLTWSEVGERSFRFRLVGGEIGEAAISLVLPHRPRLDAITASAGGKVVALHQGAPNRLDGVLPVNQEISLRW